MYKTYLKRLFDVFISLLCLLVFIPVIIFTGALLSFSLKGNPFFLQKRPGKNEILFRIIKFKTMNDSKDNQGNLLPDKERLTKTGRFIRKTSLDEIPQLINVLKGDMSLVGPRPLLVEYLPLYNNFQKKRHWVKPGITGWAQVNGRNNLNWEERFELDVWYVQNQSFSLDVKIIWKTINKVIRKEGVNQIGSASMEPFKGNN